MKIPIGSEPYLEAVLTHPVLGDGRECRITGRGINRDPVDGGIVAKYRSLTVELGLSVIDDGENKRGRIACDNAAAVAAEIKTAMVAEPQLAPLFVDVDGRLSKALKGQARFLRWGKHYLRALTRAHGVQMCTNFMDR
jgi:hypothetical protein